MRPSENAQWLAVEGWCTPEEGDALYGQAKQTDGLIVEIGTGMGRSAIAMALSGKTPMTIDDNKERLSQAVHFASLCGVSINALCGDSREDASIWGSVSSIAFLYIDGWHDSANVRADYAAWAPHVVPNGAIWFHDAYGAGWPDVHTLIDELVANGELALDGYVGTIAKCRKVAP